MEVRAEGAPAGWGAPVYGKLDAELAGALMSINAVKGVEIGDGLRRRKPYQARRTPTRCGRAETDPVFSSNHAGGVLGGISTGQPIVARLALKPPPRS